MNVLSRAFLAIFLMNFSTAFAAVELAKVGPKTITDDDLKHLMSALPPAAKQQFNQNADSKVRLIENLVIEELFVQEGQKAGITNDKEFQQAAERARRQLLAQRFLQKSVEPKMTEANYQKYFTANKLRYSNDEVHAEHVLVKTDAEAKEVYDKAVKGEDFQVLAKKYSKDPSAAQNQGDLGYFKRSRMPEEFANAAFSLKKGEISKPVKTNFGFHIIKLVDKREGKDPKFADIKEQVQEDFRNDSVKQLIDKLKKDQKVSVNEDKVRKLSL